jgi:hypothetical protein
MPTALERIKAFKCTYEDCDMSFDTEREMKRHKRTDDAHDYCHKCDLDCEDPDAYAYHKILEPDNHLKSCRTCGEEYHTDSGLRRHTERASSCDMSF